MAKTALLIDTKRYRDLVVLLNGNLKAERKTPEEVGRVVGISESTMYRHLKNPEEMRLKDLNRLGRLLGVDIEQLRKAAIKY